MRAHTIAENSENKKRQKKDKNRQRKKKGKEHKAEQKRIDDTRPRGRVSLTEAESMEHKNCSPVFDAESEAIDKGEACARVTRARVQRARVREHNIIIGLYITLGMYAEQEATGQTLYIGMREGKGTGKKERLKTEAHQEAETMANPPPLVFLGKPLRFGGSAHTPHPGRKTVGCRVLALQALTEFFGLFILPFFPIFYYRLHDGLKKITPEERYSALKPICWMTSEKICTQRRSSARGGAEKICAEERYSARALVVMCEFMSQNNHKYLTLEVAFIYYLYSYSLTFSPMKDFSEKMEWLWAGYIIASLVLHLSEAPGWAYMILMIIFFIHISFIK